MAIDAVEIVRCPAGHRAEALALVLCELAPSLRRNVAGGLLDIEDVAAFANEPLFIARRGKEICGAAWGQRQAGNIATFWPPQVEVGEDQHVGFWLAEAVIAALDDTAVEMTQVFLSPPASETVEILRHIGFSHLTDLLYMTCESLRFPIAAPEPCELDFVPYDGTQRGRLIKLIGRTYDGTLDCTGLDGVRDLENVVSGYQGTGEYRPENWLFVQNGGQDVGVLLLTDHPKGRYWELVYMALVLEVRGRGWGRQITHYAQWLVRGANVERIVVAVDAANSPAVDMYRSSGFELWDRRVVYIRVPKVG